MIFNSSKARALNKTAQGISGQIEYWQGRLRENYDAKMPPKAKKDLWGRLTYEDPPPELIPLPREFVERLIDHMEKWRRDLLKHTEPFAK